MGGGGSFGPKGVAYLESQVVDGVEDYVRAGADRLGRWTGHGAARLNLSGDISRAELHGVFGAEVELPALAATRPPGTTNTGFHVSLSPPKSVSVLWALADDATAHRVEQAHTAAVDATVAWLEDHAGFARQGRGGRFQIDSFGLVVAVFDHRTSRNLDPQLHSHLLIANRVERSTDGAWRALDSTELWNHLKPGGIVYQAAVRAELSTRLGVEWGTVSPHGQADIVGVPQALIDRFSSRAVTVDRVLAHRIEQRETELGRGLTDKERERLHRQVTLDTRKPKSPEPIDTDDLRARWRQTADDLDLRLDEWLPLAIGGRALGQMQLAIHAPDLTGDERALVLAQVAETNSVWHRADVVNRIGPLAPPGLADGDAVRRWVDRNVSATLADHEVVHLRPTTIPVMPDQVNRADGHPWHEHHGAARYTTRSTLALEQAVMDAFHDGQQTGLAIVARPIVKRACATDGLDIGQAAAIERLLTRGDAIAVLVGPAGTGKTTALGAAAKAWATAGLDVHAVAPSAVAAGVLAADTGLRADTLAHWLRTSPRMPGVVVCDEAGMVSTRDLDTLITRCRDAGAQLVLVGDPAQLGSIDAGGLFPLMARDAVTLERVHRFRHAWEGPASLALRDGDRDAIDTYDARGRLAAAFTPADAVDQAVAAWRAHPDTLLLAADHATVDQVAHAIRAERIAEGSVEPAGTLTSHGQLVGVGDHVVTLRNDRSLVTTGRQWVRNGDRWTVTHRDDDDGLTVTSGRGDITLPAAYVTEHVGLGYALTVHKAQGSTVDRAVLIATESTDPKLLYVGLTRGREHNQAIVITNGDDVTAADTLRAAIGRPRNQPAAITALVDTHAAGERLDTLVPLYNELRSILAEAGPDPRPHLERAHASLKIAQADLRRARDAAVAATERVPRAVAALDTAAKAWAKAAGVLASRLNPERAGQAFLAHAHAKGAHEAALRQVEITCDAVRKAEATVLLAGGRIGVLQDKLASWQAWHDEHPKAGPAAAKLEAAISGRIDTLAVGAVARRPVHLTRLLGPLPAYGRRADEWRRAAGAIEAYRETWGVATGEIHLPPADLAQHRAWTAAVGPSVAAAIYVSRQHTQEVNLPCSR